ncbi:MBL fold metallo-hydrolase [Halieaceae bacterium IMCC14734]|uniref:MBL fold metallo-hydrolase n=2 Tax=Candidatus Litorirhabdus singularis TaxID=2518993 RepID=A0ABT3TLR4_9GAMM|nr:MBL fold metallo-hydrolase [Candidatus Litorirhabdus singularis]
MTGPGTNTYLLGDKEIAVLDPGPLLDEHVAAILEAGAGRIRWIVTTHTHPDHSPAWLPIQQATGAQVIGALPWDDKFQDDTFAPDVEVEHDYLLSTDEFNLRAVYTPGHVGNHFCYLLEEDGMLFTGDHIMQGSTVVIVPPSGDMKAYIDSLRLLLDYPLKALAPGHGSVIDDPAGAVNWLVNHRLKREQKVVDSLQQTGAADLDTLVLVVYDDVDASLHEMAKLSMTAHLIKLQQESRAHLDGDHWSLV